MANVFRWSCVQGIATDVGFLRKISFKNEDPRIETVVRFAEAPYQGFMRGHFYLKIAAATLGMGLMVGCGGSVDPEPSTQAHKTSPSSTYDTPSEDQGTTPTHTDPGAGSQEEIFRDYAAFVYRNDKGQQILVQWLLSGDGTDYYTRSCPVQDKGGPLWKECRDWSWFGKPILEMGSGMKGFGKAGGMGAYTYSGVDDNGEPIQLVAQTFFNDRGDERRGRICTVDPKSADPGSPFASCTDFKTLELQSIDLHIDGVSNFHDDNLLTFKNANGDDVFSESVLSIDGSQAWSRSCLTSGGAPPSGPGCDFGSAMPLTRLGSHVAAVSGHGAFVYDDGGTQMVMETIITVSGSESQQRICPINEEGPDYESCGQWTPSSLTDLHGTQGPL